MAEIKNIKNQARANTMTNLEKYNKIFIGMFHKTEEELPGLKYRGIPLWDSIGHMKRHLIFIWIRRMFWTSRPMKREKKFLGATG